MNELNPYINKWVIKKSHNYVLEWSHAVRICIDGGCGCPDYPHDMEVLMRLNKHEHIPMLCNKN